jgi:hypothetical protein
MFTGIASRYLFLGSFYTTYASADDRKDIAVSALGQI